MRGSEVHYSWQSKVSIIEELSSRERDVFLLLGSGYSNRKIAAELDISEYTIKAHMANIFKKLQVESRLQAGLISLVHQNVTAGCVKCRTPR
ncbi:response regulator transcription factor [Streptomyces sp. NPDC085927]|uniref:response regulator transcription factor n=1 Tax=Streptomyces sp. NPDC085927 TaxID=3365738 RepID=UPI0037D2DAA2